MSASSSNLPPLTENGVFSVSSSIMIDAPIEKVWQIMLDFPSYKEWNPFVRGQTIVDRGGNALSDQTPKAGQYLLIAPVHLPPTMGEPGWFQKQSAFEMITTVDHENHRVAWINIALPSFLLSAHRWQALSVVDGKTKYETIEVFGGIFGYLVKFFMYDKLVLGFNAQAEGLKKQAEKD
ncbi:hypothetical protein H0H81_005813 [Sphagnurus paluster]|uniref:Coenzyme Q-binding protein COQ10 START domain-containing protein n=1 Tax=Sphagnurus paluster TaxID=117069 RepID=A0A9P7K6S6_9AGAR|nr:hypothetical protein H0H81_005813 [Sphagnurus paluster]